MVGEQIKKRRIELGLTQKELAEKLGYKSNTTINKIELGINDISQSKVMEFAKALNTTPAYIMGWDSLEYVAEEDRGIVKWATKNNLTPIELPDEMQALNTLLRQYKYYIIAREGEDGKEYAMSFDNKELGSGGVTISEVEISEMVENAAKHLEIIAYNVTRKALERQNDGNVCIGYTEV